MQAFFHQVAACSVSDLAPQFRSFRGLDVVKAATRRELLRRLMRGKDFIDSCYCQPISVSDMARAALLSEFYFIKPYRKAYGQSPYQYLLEKRLSQAAILLRTTEARITDVARSSGFPELNSFCRAFRKYTGHSPGQARLR